jgi:hypothetical protein
LKGHQTTQADPLEVKRVMAYAAEHGLGKEFEAACGGDPFQVTAARLREIEVGLQETVEAQEASA